MIKNKFIALSGLPGDAVNQGECSMNTSDVISNKIESWAYRIEKAAISVSSESSTPNSLNNVKIFYNAEGRGLFKRFLLF